MTINKNQFNFLGMLCTVWAYAALRLGFIKELAVPLARGSVTLTCIPLRLLLQNQEHSLTCSSLVLLIEEPVNI